MSQPTVLYEYSPPNFKRYLVQRYSPVVGEWMDNTEHEQFDEATNAADELGKYLGLRTRVVDAVPGEGGNGE